MKKKLKTGKQVSLSKRVKKEKSSYKPSIPINPDWKSVLTKHQWPILGILIILAVLILAWPSPTANSSSGGSAKVAAAQQVLGNNSLGLVIKEGPYGNTSSNYKVAYILGQHPRESRSHKAVREAVKNNSNSLRYCYYLYYINVTQETYDYDESRLNGQKLSKEFVVPDINQGNYTLAVDVHASNGASFDQPYVFVPIDNEKSLKIAGNLSSSIKWLYYYELPDYTSPYYTTIPLIQNGTPSIIFEAYAEPSSIIGQQCLEFVMGVDQLNFKSF
ncbi:MAG: hypothetical protein ABFC91_01465 [Methanobacteriaceae archaeon]